MQSNMQHKTQLTLALLQRKVEWVDYHIQKYIKDGKDNKK